MRKQWELFVSADTTASSKPSDSEPITKISWKVIDYGGPPYFHLYVTLNDKADYYVGYFYGENFETGEFIDTPANVLTAASAEWAGMGELFYIYQKSETELALMNHYVSYMTPPDEREEYQEILTLPIEKGSEIEVGDVLYDTVSYYGFDETWLRDMVTESNNPARTDSMLVNIDYERERFEGLAVNDGEPLTFGPKIPLTSESEGYVDFIAKILADNGLEGEPVHIREIVKTDLEGDGIDEVLLVASNLAAPDQNKGQYSIVLLRKVIDGKIESLFLTKQIKNMLTGDWNDRLLYDYELREIVDLDHDGVCELLLSETYHEGRFYLVYKLVDGEMQLILENGFGL